MERHIRARAYEIWENEGKPEGRAHEHWELARSEFSDAAGSSSGKSRKTTSRAAGKNPGTATRAPAATGTKKPQAAKPAATTAKKPRAKNS